MPIVVTSALPPVDPPAPPPPPPPPVELPEIGSASATYYAPDGSVWPLTDRARGWYTLAEGVSGLGAAPRELTVDAYPRGGARVRHVQPQPRTIVWPLRVTGQTHMQFIERWRALARAFTRTSTDGPGVLEIARPDGSRRQIAVHYQEGFEGLGTAQSGRIWDVAAVSLFCEDPYWYDPEPVIVHREAGTAGSFFAPYPTVSSSQLLGDTTLANPGDVVAWPQFTITGPASLVTFTRTDTGESFKVDPNAAAVAHGNLSTGQQVTVETDPPRVRYQNGDNWVGALDWPTAVLWGLAPGDNPVTFQLSGSSTGSAVDLVFYPRYETA